MSPGLAKSKKASNSKLEEGVKIMCVGLAESPVISGGVPLRHNIQGVGQGSYLKSWTPWSSTVKTVIVAPRRPWRTRGGWPGKRACLWASLSEQNWQLA